jgi:N-carbamoylputrescine amidase
MKIGLIQMACEPDPDANLRHALELLERAAGDGAEVICLPELFRSRYFCQTEDAAHFDLAEPIPGPTTDAVAAFARRRRVVVAAPVFERRASGLYHNSAVWLDEEGALRGHYRKMHIPDDPGYYEKFYFTPGDLGFQAWASRRGRLGILICWDQWYPEAARLTALRGAEVLFYPTAIGWHPGEKEEFGAGQRDAWITIQRGHAIANGAYVAAANRVGHETPAGGGPGIEFWGSSFIIDPFGATVAMAAADREEVLVAEIDLGRVEETRRHWPFLRDRRIDAYQGLTQRYLDQEPR